MKTKAKEFFSSVAIILLLVLIPSKISSAEDVSIMIDSQLQRFDQPAIIEDGRTLVPLRDMFQALEAEVDWDPSQGTIHVHSGQLHVFLKTGTATVVVNQSEQQLDVEPRITNDRTMVPLRFIADVLGASVYWDQQACVINVFTNEQQNQYYNGEPFKVNEISIGDSIETVLLEYGSPQRKVLSEYGFEWYVYHQEYKDYFQVGVLNNEVVAFYTNHDLINTGVDIALGTPKEVVHKRLGDPLSSILKGSIRYQYHSKGEWELYVLGDHYVTIFYDIFADDQVTAMQVVEKEVEHSFNSFYGSASDRLRQSFEFQVFDLANATRVREGLAPLVWSEKVANTARKHSFDMATNDYFAHDNLQEKSPFDRMEADDIEFRTAGENIAVGQTSAIFAHEGWMNSRGHRNNVLRSHFKRLGVGVAFDGNRPYFTQNFYTIY